MYNLSLGIFTVVFLIMQEGVNSIVPSGLKCKDLINKTTIDSKSALPFNRLKFCNLSLHKVCEQLEKSGQIDEVPYICNVITAKPQIHFG